MGNIIKNEKGFFIDEVNGTPIVFGLTNYGILSILSLVAEALRERGYKGVVYFDESILVGPEEYSFFMMDFDGESFVLKSFAKLDERDDLTKDFFEKSRTFWQENKTVLQEGDAFWGELEKHTVFL